MSAVFHEWIWRNRLYRITSTDPEDVWTGTKLENFRGWWREVKVDDDSCLAGLLHQLICAQYEIKNPNPS